MPLDDAVASSGYGEDEGGVYCYCCTKKILAGDKSHFWGGLRICKNSKKRDGWCSCIWKIIKEEQSASGKGSKGSSKKRSSKGGSRVKEEVAPSPDSRAGALDKQGKKQGIKQGKKGALGGGGSGKRSGASPNSKDGVEDLTKSKSSKADSTASRWPTAASRRGTRREAGNADTSTQAAGPAIAATSAVEDVDTASGASPGRWLEAAPQEDAQVAQGPNMCGPLLAAKVWELAHRDQARLAFDAAELRNRLILTMFNDSDWYMVGDLNDDERTLLAKLRAYSIPRSDKEAALVHIAGKFTGLMLRCVKGRNSMCADGVNLAAEILAGDGGEGGCVVFSITTMDKILLYFNGVKEHSIHMLSGLVKHSYHQLVEMDYLCCCVGSNTRAKTTKE